MKRLIILCLGLLLGGQAFGYPKHWWKEVPKDKLQWWEVSPHTAGKGEVVLSKRNELGVLSNFAATPFIYNGKKYATVEGLWQSMKYPEGPEDERWKWGKWPYTRAEVEQMDGHAAKKAGDFASDLMKKKNANWVTYRGKKMVYRTKVRGEHYKIIRQAMEAKFKQNEKVRKVLSATGKLRLKADHTVSPADPPAWKYYQIWTEIRHKL